MLGSVLPRIAYLGVAVECSKMGFAPPVHKSNGVIECQALSPSVGGSFKLIGAGPRLKKRTSMTKAVSLLLLSSLALSVQGQAPTDIFDKAPPGVEDALRARVNAFYQTWVDGKFRAGEKFVAEDAQEIYYSMQKQKFGGCEIIRIKYERDFNDAIVTVSCKGKWNIQGKELDSTLAHSDFWSIEKELWVWTVKPVTTVETPFGTSHYGNIEGSGKLFDQKTGLPKDFDGLGKAILNQISVDKDQVVLSSFEKSSAVVTVKNGMNGYMDLRADVDNAPPGLTWKFDVTGGSNTAVTGGHNTAVTNGYNTAKIPGQGEAKLTLSYDPTDKTPKARAILRLTVEQTSKVFPISLTFAISEELQKTIEKSKTGK